MRIIAIADQHGNLYPERLLPADILLVAGDVCPSNYGPRHPHKEQILQDSWLPKWSEWLQKQPVRTWFACWGNHDYASATLGFHDGLIEWEGLNMWFSPWSNEFMGWNWMKTPDALGNYYDTIPKSVDIIVSHQPPYGLGDLVPPSMYDHNKMDRHVGSKELLATIERVQPKFVICGHIHNGHGMYRHGDTTVFNVALVDEAYRPVNNPTVFEL